MDKNAPDFRRPQKLGSVAAISILGRLHYQYIRIYLSTRDNSTFLRFCISAKATSHNRDGTWHVPFQKKMKRFALC